MAQYCPDQTLSGHAGTWEQIQLIFDKTADYVQKQKDAGLLKEIPMKEFKEDIDTLRRASTHWIRHTGASMALGDGEDIKEISDTLGHSDQRITEKIYSIREHALRATKRRV